MHDKKLLNDLDRLRREVYTLTGANTADREKLNRLINDIEKKIDEPADTAHHHRVMGGLNDAIRQFETDHPRATAILNEIMVTLSNMGI